jgi:hypothetical protein
MKDTPSAALIVSESSCATGRLDATGGSVALGAVSAGEGANVLNIARGIVCLSSHLHVRIVQAVVTIYKWQQETHPGIPTGGPEEDPPVPIGLGIGDLKQKYNSRCEIYNWVF